MIALDLQPFSIVEDVGFVRLIQQLEPPYKLPSRRYITESVIPRISTGNDNGSQKNDNRC